MKRIFFAMLLAASAVFSVSSAIEIYDFDSPEQEETFKKLGKELRCPKCQNNNIADSNSGLAQDLRLKVYSLLKQNKNEDEIVGYMVARYGNFVTYNPPMTFSTAILWLGPLCVVLGGFFLLVWRSRKFKTQKEGLNLSREEQDRLARLLAEDLDKKKETNG